MKQCQKEQWRHANFQLRLVETTSYTTSFPMGFKTHHISGKKKAQKT